MVSSGNILLIATVGVCLPVLAEDVPHIAPVPKDPLELATGEFQTATEAGARESVLTLLERSRQNYALRTTRLGYDLKVSFSVSSGGTTEFDGAWKMEDIFDPQRGLRWTATADAGYTITEISSNGKLFAESTSGNIPLRLQEARAALFDSMPSSANVQRGVIRTSQVEQATCVLMGGAGNALPTGRGWDETEECIDPQSGLLKVHSQAPGRYFSYDYTNAPRIAGRMFPRSVTITEGGRVVSKISVDSLEEMPAADPSLFTPTQQMKERGRPIMMAGAQKVWRVEGLTSLGPNVTMHPVCVFGLVTPTGDLVEAHSLQPSDPHSAEAVEAAQHMSFPPPPRLGKIRPPAQQHFEFVFVNFASSQ